MSKVRMLMMGKKFGRLTVIADADYTNDAVNHKRRNRYVHCQCDCGNKTSVRVDHLRRGMTRSCGCLSRDLQWHKSFALAVTSVSGECDAAGVRAVRAESEGHRVAALSLRERIDALIESEPRRHRAEVAHDLPPGTYDALMVTQDGVCAICRKPPGARVLAVDHDHATNAVRGLLCSGCNTGLGLLRDNVDYLANAIVYLTGARPKITRGPNARE